MKQNLVIAALFILAFLGGYVAPWNPDNAQASILEYGKGNATLERDAIRFHLQVNETVNDFLEVLIGEEEPNVEYVATSEDCDESNVSTFCLAIVLNEELLAFEKGMLIHKERFREITENAEEDERKTLKEAIKSQASRTLLADSEIEAARKAIDLALAVYNETQIAYPVHKELVRMINNLEEYRDNLAEIRDTIELYPSRFNDATTIKCK